MEVIRFTAFSTPYGPMIAAASARGVCRLLPPGQTMDDLVRWVARKAPTAELVPDASADWRLRTQVLEYLAGTRRAFTVPLDLHGTPFQRAVWRRDPLRGDALLRGHRAGDRAAGCVAGGRGRQRR